jgi:hypothetical protein
LQGHCRVTRVRGRPCSRKVSPGTVVSRWRSPAVPAAGMRAGVTTHSQPLVLSSLSVRLRRHGDIPAHPYCASGPKASRTDLTEKEAAAMPFALAGSDVVTLLLRPSAVGRRGVPALRSFPRYGVLVPEQDVKDAGVLQGWNSLRFFHNRAPTIPTVATGHTTL